VQNRLLRVLLLIAAVFAVYWPSLQNDFVWDDTALVFRDPLIRSWRLIPECFRHYLFLDATGSNFYRPLQRLTYTADYALYAFQPWGFHLTNILLHAGAVVALFFFLEQLIGNKTLAPFVVSLIWAIHPLHTSAVIYVSGRADLLAALCIFCALRSVLKNGRITLGASGWLFAAALAKESALVALPIAFLANFLRGDRRAVPRSFAFCAGVAVAYAILRFSAESTGLLPPGSEEGRIVTFFNAIADYAALLIFPINLHMERNAGSGGILLLGVGLFVGFFIVARRAHRTNPTALFCLLAFSAAYLPISNLLPLNASLAEHWLYLPSAFLLAAIASAAWKPRAFWVAVLWLWILFLGGRTFARNFDWKNQRTFLERTIAAGGNSARMLINLGTLESAEGRQDLAIAHFRAALQRSPDQPFGLLGLGAASIRKRDFAQARSAIERAQKLPFIHAEALQQLATLEYLEKGTDRTDLLAEAAAESPRNWPMQKRYILHLAERGDLAGAIDATRHLLEDQPFRADSWLVLGDLLQGISRFDLARHAYQQAAAYDVHDSVARAKLASLPSRE
jgi:Flp pilus assembly protein TadD